MNRYRTHKLIQCYVQKHQMDIFECALNECIKDFKNKSYSIYPHPTNNNCVYIRFDDYRNHLEIGAINENGDPVYETSVLEDINGILDETFTQKSAEILGIDFDLVSNNIKNDSSCYDIKTRAYKQNPFYINDDGSVDIFTLTDAAIMECNLSHNGKLKLGSIDIKEAEKYNTSKVPLVLKNGIVKFSDHHDASVASICLKSKGAFIINDHKSPSSSSKSKGVSTTTSAKKSNMKNVTYKKK